MKFDKCPDCLKNKRLIALDIESSGLDIIKNTIIELGVIEIINGEVKTEYTKLFGGGHSSMYLVRKVHHIKDSERIGKKTFKQCAEKISSFLSNSIIITHNGNNFDIPMIQQKLKEAGYEITNYKLIDTLQLVRKMRKSNEEEDKKIHGRNTLSNLCKEFNLVYGGDEGNRAHRGLEDSQATVNLLFYLLNNKKIELAI
ncbi:MAG: 3'-5' exonuclease [Alphaproteobacteria bacterium]|nr:3'-5' exonuclease [Alphaproteobacteria bacterium]